MYVDSKLLGVAEHFRNARLMFLSAETEAAAVLGLAQPADATRIRQFDRFLNSAVETFEKGVNEASGLGGHHTRELLDAKTAVQNIVGHNLLDGPASMVLLSDAANGARKLAHLPSGVKPRLNIAGRLDELTELFTVSAVRFGTRPAVS